MLGIIRVLTTEDENILYEHGHLLKKYADIESISQCIEDQPHGIYDDHSQKIATPKIVELAKEMTKNHSLKALTISCAADPALEETRAAVDVPVLGAGTCGVYAASMVGKKVGIMGLRDEAPSNMKEALGDRFHAYASSPIVNKTTDLFADEAKESLYKASCELVDAGSDVILFACTGFSTVHLKTYLMERLQVPIIDLVEAQGIGYQLIG